MLTYRLILILMYYMRVTLMLMHRYNEVLLHLLRKLYEANNNVIH